MDSFFNMWYLWYSSGQIIGKKRVRPGFKGCMRRKKKLPCGLQLLVILSVMQMYFCLARHGPDLDGTMFPGTDRVEGGLPPPTQLEVTCQQGPGHPAVNVGCTGRIGGVGEPGLAEWDTKTATSSVVLSIIQAGTGSKRDSIVIRVRVVHGLEQTGANFQPASSHLVEKARN